MTTKTTTKKTTSTKASKATPKKTPAKKPARANTGATVAKAKPKASTKAKPAEKATRPKQAAKPKRVSGLDLAAKVLAEAKEPLQAKAIAERAIAAGWKTTGKTPHATLYAAMIREIAKKGKDSRFTKTDRGLFATNK